MMITVSVVVVFAPLASNNNNWVSMDGNGIIIKAPFVDLSIPYSSIQNADMVTGFKPGIRIIGYGFLRRGSGSFTNEMLGTYTFTGTTTVDRMIVIRSSNKKVDIVAFNLPSAEAIEELFHKIAKSIGSDSTGMPYLNTEKNKKSYRSTKRIIVALSAVAVIAVAAILIITMTMGHVDAYLDDDSLI